tara:strand:- start:139 stop:657 length:519 start_codon:yes stop_codon:yes gene_type:complete
MLVVGIEQFHAVVFRGEPENRRRSGSPSWGEWQHVVGTLRVANGVTPVCHKHLRAAYVFTLDGGGGARKRCFAGIKAAIGSADEPARRHAHTKLTSRKTVMSRSSRFSIRSNLQNKMLLLALGPVLLITLILEVLATLESRRETRGSLAEQRSALIESRQQGIKNLVDAAKA